MNFNLKFGAIEIVDEGVNDLNSGPGARIEEG